MVVEGEALGAELLALPPDEHLLDHRLEAGADEHRLGTADADPQQGALLHQVLEGKLVAVLGGFS